MENPGLRRLLPTLEETEEPWAKKIKIDISHLSSVEEQKQSLQKLNDVDKNLSNKFLSFPEELWNFSQNGLELQEGNNTNLNTNTRKCAYLKSHMNANLQARLLGNISFYEKLTLETKAYSNIRDTFSDFNQNNSQWATKPESWALHTKEIEKSLEKGSIVKGNTMSAVNIIFANSLAGSLITTIESLFKDLPEFQGNKNDTVCFHVHESFRSEEQYHIPKAVDESSNGKTSHLHLPVRNLMKARKSLSYDVVEHGNILSSKKQMRFPANSFRKSKVFKYRYIPYSKNHGVIHPKLKKCAALELLLQDATRHNCSIATERDDTTIVSKRILPNVQQREISKEGSTKECFIVSKGSTEDIFLVGSNAKEQMASQVILSNNKILPENNFHSSTLWGKSACNPTKMQALSENVRFFNYLSLVPNTVKNLNRKSSDLQMVVSVVTCIQERKTKAFNENNIFPIKNLNTSHFVSRVNNKHITRRFGNDLKFANKSKYASKYVGACSRVVMEGKAYASSGNFKENVCGFVGMKACISPFDTHTKIHLSTDSEEVYLISCLSNAIFNEKNNKKNSKGCTDTDTIITYSVHSTLPYCCVSPKLLTNVTSCNYFLVQESKNKACQYFEDIPVIPLSGRYNTNSRWHKYEINDVPFLINGLNSGNILKGISEDVQYFISTVFHYLCLYQHIIVDVKAWCSKMILHGNRGKQRDIFENEDVLQYQPVCGSKTANSLMYPKVKKENVILFLQTDSLLRSTRGSELVFVKQNSENDNRMKNVVVEQRCINKNSQYQNLTVSHFKDKSAKCVGSKDTLIAASCRQPNQECFEDTTEEPFSLETKNKHEFEMRNQFDLVLEELNMFNKISKEDENNLLCGKTSIFQEDFIEQNNSDRMLDKDFKNVCENKVNMTFITSGTTVDNATAMKQNKNEQSSYKDTVIKRAGEQEVPLEYCPSSISDEELFYSSSEEHCVYACEQPFPWKPAFVSRTFMKKHNYSLQRGRGNPLLDGIIRVQPLKTCRGPLRVGLSRKAKPKQLHPYLK